MRRFAVVLAGAALVAASGIVIANAQTERSPLRVFTVTLAGENENPAGDPVATGTAVIRARAGQAQICYQLAAHDLSGRAVAAHIHRGAGKVAGPVLIPLRTPNTAGASRGCAKTTKARVRAILAHPSRYYVNVHTAEFPGGAIRAQLRGSRTVLGTIVHLQLKGTSEPNATGTAVLRIRKNVGLVCYRLHAANVTLPTVAAHIHKGAAGANGPVVVPLNAPGNDGNSSGCAAASASVIDDILANRAGYYVNVHTKEHPAGAIRAQLG
jgi:CHRD domain-containing protein